MAPRSPKTDPRKVTLYLPVAIREEMTAEAKRLDRSLSGVIRIAWKLAKKRVSQLPGEPYGPVRG